MFHLSFCFIGRGVEGSGVGGGVCQVRDVGGREERRVLIAEGATVVKRGFIWVHRMRDRMG